MVKSREPGSFEDAITMICGDLSYDATARAVKASEKHVRRWSNDTEASLPNLKQALDMEAACIAATGRGHLSVAWERMLAKKLREVAVVDREVESVPESLMDVTASVGALASRLREAMADNRITRVERDAVLRAIKELRDQTDELERAVMHSMHRPALKA